MSFKNRIIAKIEEKLYNLNIICEVDGLNIVDMRDKDDGYKNIICSSLELISSHDPKMYKRVLNEISWIVNTNLVETYSGQYIRRTKGCIINFENYTSDQVLVSTYFAGIIVHEATHGFLQTKGVKYTQQNKVQIERICTTEENRFYNRMERFFPEYEGRLAQEFDPNDWLWGESKWKKAYLGFKRIMSD